MKKALVVVDYQYDFVCGSLGFDRAKSLESKIKSKIKMALELNNDFIFTMDTHDHSYLNTHEGKRISVSHCIKGSKGWGIYGEIASFLPYSIKVFEKKSFGSIDLAMYFKNIFYDTIEFVGVITNICVLSNVVLARAASPESNIIVDSNCIASPDEELHQKALDIMRNLHVDIL